MAADGTPFKGILYPGLFVTPDGPRVIEFNARFGDPEAEALLPLLESDLLEIMLACVNGTLDRVDVALARRRRRHGDARIRRLPRRRTRRASRSAASTTSTPT